MRNVEIYTTPLCGFCHAAKRLLQDKVISVAEIDVARDPSKRHEMVQRSNGRRTVPQIFVDGDYVGDCNHLYSLERSGKLDPILAA